MWRDWIKKRHQIRDSFFLTGIIIFILLIVGAFLEMNYM